MMFDKWFIPAMTIAGYSRRFSLVILFLASLAVLVVATSVGAFIYVTRKGENKTERKFHDRNYSRENSSKISSDIRHRDNPGRIGIFNGGG